MPLGRAKAKKVTMHIKKGRLALKRAITGLVKAKVLAKNGKRAKAAKVRKAGRVALGRAIGHAARAAHAKVGAKRARVAGMTHGRVAARRRHGGGGGGGGIMSTIGSIASGILGFL
jgi:hypothetical protein